MKYLPLIALLLSITGCSSSQMVSIEWKAPQSEELKYRTTIKENVDGRGVLSAHAILNSVNIRDEYFRTLSSTVLSQPNYETTLAFNKSAVQVRVKAKDSGALHILADINNHGSLQSFYLREKQKNIISAFFQLPLNQVAVGDRWSIPIALIQVDGGYIPSDMGRVNQVELLSININPEGERLAKIGYVLEEYIAGEFLLPPDSESFPVSARYTYIGYGEFMLDKGYWNKIIFNASASGEGLPQAGINSVYGLELSPTKK